jgi:hypothetical protein
MVKLKQHGWAALKGFSKFVRASGKTLQISEQNFTSGHIVY